MAPFIELILHSLYFALVIRVALPASPAAAWIETGNDEGRGYAHALAPSLFILNNGSRSIDVLSENSIRLGIRITRGIIA
jgi:hypothetical protein